MIKTVTSFKYISWNHTCIIYTYTQKRSTFLPKVELSRINQEITTFLMFKSKFCVASTFNLIENETYLYVWWGYELIVRSAEAKCCRHALKQSYIYLNNSKLNCRWIIIFFTGGGGGLQMGGSAVAIFVYGLALVHSPWIVKLCSGLSSWQLFSWTNSCSCSKLLKEVIY